MARSFRIPLIFLAIAIPSTTVLFACQRVQSPPQTKSTPLTAASGKTGLPWPANPTKFKVLPEWSWDAKKNNPNDPKAGSCLPYYGKATAADVNDHINLVWNACKHIKHIPGEKLSSLHNRIQGPVDEVIRSLGYKPTEAEEKVLRSTGNETFIICNVKGGANSESSNPNSVLWSNNIISSEKYPALAQAILDLNDPRAVCSEIVPLKIMLDRACGITSICYGVIDRNSASEIPVLDGHNPRNHVIQKVILPTKMGSTLDPAARFRAGPNANVGAVNDPTAGLLSDDERKNLDSITVYPKPYTLLIGAKGDDVFSVYGNAHYVPESCDYSTGFDKWGRSMFRVQGFGKGSDFAKRPLPAEVDELFSAVRSPGSYLRVGH